MANYCTNTIVFYGDHTQLSSLYNHFKEAIDSTEGSPSMNRVFRNLNLDASDIPQYDERQYLMGVNPIEDTSGTSNFALWTETAWVPLTNHFDFLLKRMNYTNIHYVYMAEEAGCEVFINTDYTQQFLTTKYRFYSDVGGDENEAYFSTLYDLIQWANKTFKYVFIRPNATIDEIIRKLKERYKTFDTTFYIDEFLPQ